MQRRFKPTKKVYKILNANGRWLNTGCSVGYSANSQGKVWGGKGPVKSALSAAATHVGRRNRWGDRSNHPHPAEGGVIVEYELTPVACYDPMTWEKMNQDELTEEDIAQMQEEVNRLRDDEFEEIT